MSEWALAIHGGCGSIQQGNSEALDEYRASLRAIINHGQQMLADGASALETVESCVAVDEWAGTVGLAREDPTYFETPARRLQWQASTGRVLLDHDDFDVIRGTVGAVARDRDGHLAAGTSTGGLVNKSAGRIGDTPIVGAGTYASGSAAVSCTGAGEVIAAELLALRIADALARAGHAGVAEQELRERIAPG